MIPLSAVMDFKRFRGLLPVAGTLAVFLAAINGLFLLTIGVMPSSFVSRQIPLRWEFIEQAEGSAAGLAATYGETPPGQNDGFMLYIGMSTAREGIDPAVLAANSCMGKVAGICGSGGGMEYLLTLSEPVVRRKLRPSQVLICVHPAWLIGSPTDDPPASISLTGPILQRKWNVVGERLAWWNWFSNNRPFVDDKALMAIHSARVGLDTFPESDPWRQVERLGYPYHETASALRTQMEGLERRGWFDPRQYARYEAKQAKVLGDVAAGFQALGSPVAVVFMPETSTFRRRVPTEAAAYLRETLQQRFGSAAPSIMDYRDAIPDELFSDYCHMNDGGRSQFSMLLASRLRAQAQSCDAR